MKKLLSLMLLVVASSALADDWPTRPFTFIGIPEKIRSETYETIHGKMQNMVIQVVEVKEGSYDKPEIGFDFPAGSKPPLEIGETYLFKAVYDRHGIRYTEWTKMKKKPNQSLEPTRESFDSFIPIQSAFGLAVYVALLPAGSIRSGSAPSR